jgi:predicted secreted protein
MKFAEFACEVASMSSGFFRGLRRAIFAAGVFCLSGLSYPSFAQDTRLQVSVGDTETVQLDGNPSTGYSWVADAVPKIVTVDLLGYAKPELAPGERPKLGAPQKFQALITGVAPGTATLVFKYVKGHGGLPAKTQEVAVEVVGEPPDPAPAAHDPLERQPEDAMENPGEQMFDNSTGE